jgi:hypothetical protein
MYTSGTTGRPRGAVLTHQNLMCQSLTLIRVWRLFADEEVNLCASPLFHIASIGAIAPMVLIDHGPAAQRRVQQHGDIGIDGSRTGDQRVSRAGSMATAVRGRFAGQPRPVGA